MCGPRSSPMLIEAVCPAAGVALAECQQAGVLIADADTVRFRHELARRATAAQIPDYQRRMLHKKVLAVLAEPPIDPNTLAALAFHAEQAGDTDAVICHGPAAADRAAALGAHREAAELYALVLRHGDNSPNVQKVLWLERHAFSSYLCGSTAASERSFRDAIALRHELGDRLSEGDDLRWLSHMLLPLGSVAKAAEAGLASLSVLDEIGPTPQLAWSLINMATLAIFSYDPACADYAARAITLGTQLDDPAVVLRARCYPPLSAVARSDTGWDDLEKAWRDAITTEGMSEHAGIASVMLCWFAALHHHERAEDYIHESSVFCGAHDLGTFNSVVAGSGALVELHRGNWANALACAEDVLTRSGMSPSHRILPLISAALVRARRDQQPVAELLDEALAMADDLFRLGPVWAARAEAAWLAGDNDTARAEAQAGLRAAAANADPWLVEPLTTLAVDVGGQAQHRARQRAAHSLPPRDPRGVANRRRSMDAPGMPLRRGHRSTRWRHRRCPSRPGDLPATRRPRCGPSRPAAPRPTARTRSRPPSQTDQHRPSRPHQTPTRRPRSTRSGPQRRPNRRRPLYQPQNRQHPHLRDHGQTRCPQPHPSRRLRPATAHCATSLTRDFRNGGEAEQPSCAKKGCSRCR